MANSIFNVGDVEGQIDTLSDQIVALDTVITNKLDSGSSSISSVDQLALYAYNKTTSSQTGIYGYAIDSAGAVYFALVGRRGANATVIMFNAGGATTIHVIHISNGTVDQSRNIITTAP